MFEDFTADDEIKLLRQGSARNVGAQHVVALCPELGHFRLQDIHSQAARGGTLEVAVQPTRAG